MDEKIYAPIETKDLAMPAADVDDYSEDDDDNEFTECNEDPKESSRVNGDSANDCEEEETPGLKIGSNNTAAIIHVRKNREGLRGPIETSNGRGPPLSERKSKARSRISPKRFETKPAPTSLSDGEPDLQSQLRVAELEGALQAARHEHSKLIHELDRYRKQEVMYANEIEALKSARREDQEMLMTKEINLHQQISEYNDLESKCEDEKEEKVYWARKHDELLRDFQRMETMLRSSIEERDRIWNDEWERKQKTLLVERDQYRERYHVAQKAASENKEEARELQRHVLELKHSISTSTRTEGQMADDLFREKLQTLGHDLQNWTINNFRRVKPDISKLSDISKGHILDLLPAYQAILSISKSAGIQSLISLLLNREIFGSYFFGLPEEKVYQIKLMEEFLHDIASTASVNQWRSVTIAMFRRTSDQGITKERLVKASQVEEKISKILGELFSLSPSESRDRGLRSIIEQAVVLSHMFRVQRAQFNIEMPSTDPDNPALFDSSRMEDISGEDEKDLVGKKIQCVTFPVVYKAGDESGDNTHLENIIVKAKVLCRLE
ncbi:MAG: hypothetical protein M1829_006666 [Trizodia sp. TS-e1964]|nr:MAG: hypothetical protein M1829_006666 [Trizodia sp. TS-e1964]